MDRSRARKGPPAGGQTRLDLLRHDERSAIAAREHAVGLFVAGARVTGRVKVQRPAQAIGDVRKVQESRRDRSLLNGRVEVRMLAAAHSADEVTKVVAKVR